MIMLQMKLSIVIKIAAVLSVAAQQTTGQCQYRTMIFGGFYLLTIFHYFLWRLDMLLWALNQVVWNKVAVIVTERISKEQALDKGLYIFFFLSQVDLDWTKSKEEQQQQQQQQLQRQTNKQNNKNTNNKTNIQVN